METCKFTFDVGPAWDGFAHGSTWNGFDNVAVTKETLDKIVDFFLAEAKEHGFGEEDAVGAFRELQPMQSGVYSLGWGFSTVIVETPTVETAPALADRFADILRDWLTQTEWVTMVARNSTDPRYAGPVCASHDFCDANMAMDQAWRERFVMPIDGDNETHTAVWNRAWEIAREKHIGKQ